MSNFKSGSGNLDFGGKESTDDEEQKDESVNETSSTQNEKSNDTESSSSGPFSSVSATGKADDTETASGQSPSNHVNADKSAESTTEAEQYPYFVRRSNVGDERDTRLEIHVRDKVADHEAEFRNELAESLGTNEVSKTDAREFALLAAFHHPEKVAELMQDEGFGTFG